MEGRRRRINNGWCLHSSHKHGWNYANEALAKGLSASTWGHANKLQPSQQWHNISGIPWSHIAVLNQFCAFKVFN